ncbi:MAG: hypothetical protein IKO03_10670 [Lachnospiraceae bacterium]|nr:hypothetical protein [Lachnospiraceae bacterium]
MPSLINRKKAKAYYILDLLGETCTESEFVDKFKELYSKDWMLIVSKFEEEEQNTKVGKRHPMPNPDQYMKNMFRNFKNRKDAENKEG